jgi:hypothetical protein
MNRIGNRFVVTAFVAFVAASPAAGGYRLTDKEGDETLVSKGRVKEQSTEGAGPESVFDLAAARAWMSNPDQRIYWEGTIDELCTTIRQTAKTMAKQMEQQMESQLARLPPEQRAKIDEMRRAQAEKRAAKEAELKKKPGIVKLEDTDETTTIAGAPTRKYRVLVDGELYEENWLTTDPAFAKELALDKASEVMSRVSSCAENEDPTGQGLGVDEAEVYRKLYEKGWPLKVVVYKGGKAQPKSETTKIEKRDIPEKEFHPPGAYRKATLAEVMFSGMSPPNGPE